MRAQPSIRSEMDWRTMPGWFSNEDAECYRAIVANTRDRGEIVEIGCWVGRSSCCLIELVKESTKDIVLHFVDNFTNVPVHHGIEKLYDASIEAEARKNIQSTGYHWWDLLAIDSLTASKKFRKGRLDAVFIDGSHDYDSVKTDIKAWLPKIRRGGIIAGHDYNFPEVARAVDEAFLPRRGIEQFGECWLVRL